MKKQLFAYALSTLFSAGLFAQTQEETVSALVTEATENSQLKVLAHQLLDVIGPRLVGTPEMKSSHDDH